MTYNLLHLILAELEDRGAAYVNTFAPFYAMSIANHIFNQINKKREILVSGGYAADTRLHILFVAPPGMGKSYWLRHFLRGSQSICGEAVPTTFEGIVTEAGWVGTIKFAEGGESLTVPGVAMRHKFSVIGCQEFSGITNMFQSQHSKNLDTALLTSLDDGFVEKSLAAGPLQYVTYATLQTGTQPARFDLSGGMGRRFIFMEMIPTTEDKLRLRMARRESKDKRFDIQRTKQIHANWKILTQKINKLEKVVIAPEVYETFDTFDWWQYEEELYERLLIGYALLTSQFDKILTVTITNEAKGLLEKESMWRQNVSRGSQFSQALQLLKDHDGTMTLDEWRLKFLTFGSDYSQSMAILNKLTNLKIVSIRNNQIMVRSKYERRDERANNPLFGQGENRKS